MKQRLPICLILLLCTVLHASNAGAQGSVVSDPVYTAVHPRLLFWESEVPALQQRVRDGVGPDDAAYQFIRDRVHNVYPGQSTTTLLDDAYGLAEVINLALVTFLESPYDDAARDLGRQLTLVLADSFAIDNDPWSSSLRLRNLVIGYDMLLDDATEAERARVLDEIENYMVTMLTSQNYEIWHHRPYVSNQTAMIAAALGMAAIGLDYELDPALSAAAIAEADAFIDDWMSAHLERDGAYREGLLYGLWSMRNLIYYFEARLHYDGTDFSQNPAIRNMAEWLVYEMDPRGLGHTNNLQDCTEFFRPLSRHTTYFDWAMTRWNSELAGYLSLHGPGAFGINMGDDADKAGTVLWGQPATVMDPGTVLPQSRLWTGRGLYYHRTGWPLLFDSDDVVFSFYSGVFHGGHAQEDQNQFTLTGYGSRLVIDHGAGTPAHESEGHNMVFIDGAGQHNAGASIGTDGRIVRYMLGEGMDYLLGDATAAYTTYSPYNENGVPYPGVDWSWGHKDANPVLFALRTVVTVHEGPAARPYFIIVDDIDKDGGVHEYQWRLHTSELNSVDDSTNPVRITGDSGALDVYTVNPCPDSVVTAVSYFDNGAEDENANLLTLTRHTVNPRFVTLLLPRPVAEAGPTVLTERGAGGTLTTIDWGNGWTDLVITSFSDCEGAGGDTPAASVDTDARLAVVRMQSAVVQEYLMIDGTTLSYEGAERVAIADGPASVAMSGGTIDIDRLEADFSIYSAVDRDVYFHDIRVPTVREGSYLLSAATSSAGDGGAGAPGALSVRAFPNPFNPDVSISLRSSGTVEAVAGIYDVAGRRVATVWDGSLSAGETRISWDGTDDRGAPLASGVYFLRVMAGGRIHTTKLTLLK